jgi:hypothetical protein
MRFLFSVIAVLALVGFAPSLGAQMPLAAATHPSLYSFADVHRLTVVGPAMAEFTLAESPVRLAVSQAQPGAELRFSISTVEPRRWLLLLAGLALAGWVAHRRLINPF